MFEEHIRQGIPSDKLARDNGITLQVFSTLLHFWKKKNPDKLAAWAESRKNQIEGLERQIIVAHGEGLTAAEIAKGMPGIKIKDVEEVLARLRGQGRI